MSLALPLYQPPADPESAWKDREIARLQAAYAEVLAENRRLWLAVGRYREAFGVARGSILESIAYGGSPDENTLATAMAIRDTATKQLDDMVLLTPAPKQ